MLMIVVVRSKSRLMELVKALAKQAKDVRLIINENKTQYMIVSRTKPLTPIYVVIRYRTFKRVKSFKYLGNQIKCNTYVLNIHQRRNKR